MFSRMDNSFPAGQIAATNLRHYRQRLGWTLEVMSQRLDEIGHPMKVAAISKTETGKRQVSADDLAAFAAAFGVSTTDMLTPPEVFEEREVLAVVETFDRFQEAIFKLVETLDLIGESAAVVAEEFASLRSGLLEREELRDAIHDFLVAQRGRAYADDFRRAINDPTYVAQVVGDLADLLTTSTSDPGRN